MKVIIFLLFCFSVTFSQPQLNSVEIKDGNLVKLINDIQHLGDKVVDTLNIRVFKTNNEPGSAGFPNGEVTSNILIAVSGFDEYPEQKLFKISSLYSPKLIRILNENSTPIIYISFIEQSVLKLMKVKVSLKHIEVSGVKKDNMFLVKDSSIIFYQPSESEIEVLLSEEESGFNEVISDFSYHTKSVEKYLIKNGIKPSYTSAKVIIDVTNYSKSSFLFRNKFTQPIGFILSDGINDIIIKEGVFTNSEIIQIANDFFKISK